MIFLKTEEEIARIKESAIILSKTLGLIAGAIKPGIKTKELDNLAETYIRDQGAIPSFKGYDRFPASICLSVNEIVVHGIPDGYILKEGDIISVDAGVYYKGFHSDSAFTFSVGKITKEAQKLIKITKEALYLGIKEAVVGKYVGDIGAAIYSHVNKQGYRIIQGLAGHGVGRSLHEDPTIRNFGKKGKGVALKEGMVLAIEPMVSQGSGAIRHAKDGWKIFTADLSLSAHFEHTIAVREYQAEILTTYSYIEKI
jgi:methionyl aminopeptidase